MNQTVDDRSNRGDDRRRAQLLEAAERVFADAPPGGLTMTLVAEEAGVSKRLMYHYFADLQALYDGMFLARIRDHMRIVDEDIDRTSDAGDDAPVTAAFRVFFSLPSSSRRYLLMTVTDTLPPELASQRGIFLDALTHRWADLAAFDGMEASVSTMAMAMVVTELCHLGNAIDAEVLTVDRAITIAIAMAASLSQAIRESR